MRPETPNLLTPEIESTNIAPEFTPDTSPNLAPIEPKPPVESVVIPPVAQKIEQPPSRYEGIEKILSSGETATLYASADDQVKNRFRVAGEQTAREIEKLLQARVISEDKIAEHIKRWLKVIPRISTAFIRKEAMLLAEKIHESVKKGLFAITIAQTNLFPQETTANFIPSMGIAREQILLVGSVIGGVMGGIFLLYIIRALVKNSFHNKINHDLVTLLLTVPKEQQLKEKLGDQNIETTRSQIATMEQVFSTIGGMKAQRGFRAWFFGRTDHMTFEIVNKNGLIHFYASIPTYLRHTIEQQLQAQYPFIQIEEIEDYNLFKPNDVTASAYLQLEKTHAYPLKTYQQMESDPLNALLNPLSKLNDGSAQAVIQYVFRSSKKEWRQSSKHHIKHITEGKKDSSALLNSISKTVEYASGSSEKNKAQKEIYKPTPLEEQLIKAIDEKASKAGLDCNIRIITSAPDNETAATILKTIINSFSQYNLYQFGNSFKAHVVNNSRIIDDYILRRFVDKQNIIVNTNEMASLFHLPLSSTEIPNIKWLGSRKSPPPDNIPKTGVLLGYNTYRGVKTEVRMKDADRMRHLYVIGQTGTGKSTLLLNMAYQDILDGKGACIMDPHGDLADALIGAIPPHRIDDVIYFDPSDTSYPLGMNMLEFDPKYPEQKTFVINEMLKIFDKLYDLKTTGGPMFEQYMRNAMLLIMEDTASGSTIMEISKVLSDEDFRRSKLAKCTNQVVYDFWTKEAEKAGGEAALANMVPYITSKLTQFVSNDIMRPIIGQQESAFNFRDIMDKKKILLINLAKGKIGDLNAKLLGMIIIGKILMSALSRTDIPESERQDFFLYVDEFQNFLTDSIAIILSEARKYRLSLNIAHQYIGQLKDGNNEQIKNAIFGNVGSKAIFRISPEDAEVIEKDFAPVFNQFDLVNIEARTAYLKLLIDNTAARPFNISTMAPPASDFELGNALKELSKLTYGRSRELIEEEIKARAFM